MLERESMPRRSARLRALAMTGSKASCRVLLALLPAVRLVAMRDSIQSTLKLQTWCAFQCLRAHAYLEPCRGKGFLVRLCEMSEMAEVSQSEECACMLTYLAWVSLDTVLIPSWYFLGPTATSATSARCRPAHPRRRILDVKE